MSDEAQAEVDDSLEFEMHISDRVSRLEVHRVAITKMRGCHWPYVRIASWLVEERGVKVNPETLRRFCLSRGIEKGDGAKLKSQRRRSSNGSRQAKKSDSDDNWDLVVPNHLETWKSRGEDAPPDR